MRVVVADDSILLREGLIRLLGEAEHEVVAAVGDGTALVEAIAHHRPDVSIVDVRMPPSHTDEGLRAAIEARGRVPGTPILVLSQYVELSYADDLLADRVGALGYLLKDRVTDVEEFLDALHRVAGGAIVLDPEVVSQLFVSRRTLCTPSPRANGTCSSSWPRGVRTARSPASYLSPRALWRNTSTTSSAS